MGEGNPPRAAPVLRAPHQDRPDDPRTGPRLRPNHRPRSGLGRPPHSPGPLRPPPRLRPPRRPAPRRGKTPRGAELHARWEYFGSHGGRTRTEIADLSERFLAAARPHPRTRQAHTLFATAFTAMSDPVRATAHRG
ncbi:hypothetical protein ACFQV2_07200 [Actinokineospora soli]|uniref:Uncharacterized protein n=1 Tax=Actinokineospora soli TaxID=1048753 RepID=A0ABW2TJW5_9PSEU